MTSAIDDQLRIRDDDGVRWITMNRPESRNGLTIEVVEGLIAACDAAGADTSVRVVVLFGAGGAFCSGLDLKAAASLAMAGGADTESGMKRFHDLVRAIQQVPKPTIAALNGAAAGFGCDIALGCDLRIGSGRARLGEGFVRIGLMPDGGGTFFLPRLVGIGKAFELFYEGRMVEADEALELGLINKLWPEDGFEEAVHDYAAKLAEGPPLAFQRIKAAMLGGDGSLEGQLALESAGQLQLLQTGDFVEGVQAFLAKRDPAFTGE